MGRARDSGGCPWMRNARIGISSHRSSKSLPIPHRIVAIGCRMGSPRRPARGPTPGRSPNTIPAPAGNRREPVTIACAVCVATGPVTIFTGAVHARRCARSRAFCRRRHAGDSLPSSPSSPVSYLRPPHSRTVPRTAGRCRCSDGRLLDVDGRLHCAGTTALGAVRIMELRERGIWAGYGNGPPDPDAGGITGDHGVSH